MANPVPHQLKHHQEHPFFTVNRQQLGMQLFNAQLFMVHRRQSFLQQLQLDPAEPTQVGVFKQLPHKQLIKAAGLQIFKGNPVFQQSTQHLFGDPDVFHKGQLAD